MVGRRFYAPSSSYRWSSSGKPVLVTLSGMFFFAPYGSGQWSMTSLSSECIRVSYLCPAIAGASLGDVTCSLFVRLIPESVCKELIRVSVALLP